MKKSLILLSLLTISLCGLHSASAATLLAAWDLNEGSGSTTTQYQLGSGQTWNQVSNPSEDLPATASANFSTASGLTWGSASTAPNSTASLTFDGSNDINTLDTNVSGIGLGGTGAKTFVAWINATGIDSSGGSTILSYSPSNGQTNGADLRLKLNSDGNLRAEVSGGFFAYTDEDLRSSGWTMVAAIFDTDTNSSSFYIGGIGWITPDSLSANRAINTGTSGTETDFVIGGSQATNTSFIGGIDMVGVYSGALTESELDDIYANGIAIPEPNSMALVGFALGVLAIFRRRKF